MPALPFCHVTLRAPKPPPDGYPTAPKTIGDHLRKWRLGHDLTQAELAPRLGADETSVWNWENGYSRPTIRLISKVIELLGFDPEASQPGSLGREIAAYRRRQGLSQNELARRLRIDPATLGRWERGET